MADLEVLSSRSVGPDSSAPAVRGANGRPGSPVSGRWLSLVLRLSVGFLGLAMLGSVASLIYASGRGLDLTDEGIYLNIYRFWHNPELSFTGAPVVLGPIFEVLNWSIPALRLVKLVFLLASAGFLGVATVRYVFWHCPPSSLRREKLWIVVIATMAGSLSVYAWLPQTPGYNDLAIMFSAVAIGLALSWSTSTGRRSSVDATLLGSMIILLAFVKWPSAIFTSLGISVFLFSAGHRKRFLRFMQWAAIGGLTTLLVIQIVAGQLFERIRILTASTNTILSGTGLWDSYVQVYIDNIAETFGKVGRVGGPVIVLGLVAACLAARRRPMVGGVLYGLALLALPLVARRKGYLTGGEANVFALEATFPIFFVASMGVAALYLVSTRGATTDGTRKAAAATIASRPHERFSLSAGIVLVALAPLLQAIGTGNPMFRIAFCAGGAWVAAAGAVLLVVVERGGNAFLFPAACGLAGICGVGFVTGVEGLRIDSFRVGPLNRQTVALPGVPELDGVRVDPSAADLILRTRKILAENDLLGTPAISTSNGTGLTYALGVPHPPAGLFIEEPLPEVMRVRLREACRIGVLDSSKPLVVFSIGDEIPKVAAEELQACGIDFPGTYRRERVIPAPGGYQFMRDVGITIWLPRKP